MDTPNPRLRVFDTASKPVVVVDRWRNVDESPAVESDGAVVLVFAGEVDVDAVASVAAGAGLGDIEQVSLARQVPGRVQFQEPNRTTLTAPPAGTSVAGTAQVGGGSDL